MIKNVAIENRATMNKNEFFFRELKQTARDEKMQQDEFFLKKANTSIGSISTFSVDLTTVLPIEILLFFNFYSCATTFL